MTARPWRLVDRYLMAPAPASRLVAARLLIGAFAAIYLIARLPYWLSYAHFNPAQFRPVGVVALLLDRPLVPLAVHILTVATLAASIPFALGWRFRVTGPVFAALCLWTLTYRNSWGMVFHTENLLVLHVLVLGVTRSADALSLDARRSPGPAPDPHGRYGWPLKLMCWIVVVAYVLAGVAKLENSGTAWLWGDELRNYIAIDNARKALLGDVYSPLAAPLLHWDGLFRVLALTTMVIELGAPVALLHRWLATAWVAAAIGFHLGVLALMMIAFPYQMLGVSFVCFFRAERLAERLIVWARAAASRLRRTS